MKAKLTVFTLLFITASASQAGVVEERLQAYQAEASQPFSAAHGEKMWTEEHRAKDGKMRSCSTCHGTDLKRSGKHAKTGKVIDPMAPSVNNERLTETKKIKKWFKRNCKWVLGRTCTAQEKGDFLSYIASQ